jgi:DNA modification methylase
VATPPLASCHTTPVTTPLDGPHVTPDICDHQANTYNQEHQPAFTHEDITIFYRTTNIKTLTLYNAKQRCLGTTLNYPKATGSMKPVELMRELTRRYTPPGGLVMDICMNTGVCGAAALMEGRRFIGMELRAKQYEVAKLWLSGLHPES